MQRLREDSRTVFNNQANRLGRRLASRVDPLTDRLRSAADVARSNEAEPIAKLFERGAGYLELTSAYLETADGERLIADAEARTREHPVIAGAIAFSAGWLLIRFMRSTCPR